MTKYTLNSGGIDMQYRLVYKCRICGEKIYSGDTVEMSKGDMAAMLGDITRLEQYMNGLTGNKKMITLHNCKDDSLGFADLTGAKRVK